MKRISLVPIIILSLFCGALVFIPLCFIDIKFAALASLLFAALIAAVVPIEIIYEEKVYLREIRKIDDGIIYSSTVILLNNKRVTEGRIAVSEKKLHFIFKRKGFNGFTTSCFGKDEGVRVMASDNRNFSVMHSEQKLNFITPDKELIAFLVEHGW